MSRARSCWRFQRASDRSSAAGEIRRPPASPSDSTERRRRYMSSAGLSGRVALVFGVLRGIGRASAECMAADGARVVLTDLDREASGEVRSALVTMPDSVYFRLDATSEDAWQRVRRCRAVIRPPRHSHEQRRQRPDRRAESPVASVKPQDHTTRPATRRGPTGTLPGPRVARGHRLTNRTVDPLRPVTSRRAGSAGQSIGHPWRLEPEESPRVQAKVGAIPFRYPIEPYSARMLCKLSRGDT